MKMSVINNLKRVNSGSAVAEFLIFTLPFFTIFLLLITIVQSRSMAIAESKNLARQVIRAYVTSPNEELASIRAYQVIYLYKSTLSPRALASRDIQLNISCSTYPCFSRGNKVTATISVGSEDKAFASEYVDLWR
jgi:hypothetical protein